MDGAKQTGFGQVFGWMAYRDFSPLALGLADLYGAEGLADLVPAGPGLQMRWELPERKRIGAAEAAPLWQDVELSITFYYGEGESTMTNEEFVVLIQGGKRDKLPELWAQVERFVAREARRRLVLSGWLGGVEFGDLYDAGYLALVSAVDTFDPEAGRSFVSWLALALKTAFAEAGGYRSRKQARDPLHHAGSLDVPAGDDEDGTTLGEFQEDPQAAQEFQDAEDRLYSQQLGKALGAVLAELPVDQREAVRGRYWRGQVVDNKAHNAALRALRHPRISARLRVYLCG